MANSVASSPASATSPHVLAPASSSSTNKAPVPSPTSLHTPSIFTNKQWVIPPRPKPGRKPAADTPPTKRKAQNRAAQRAFRERRAARVGELEDQMQQVEEEYGRERESLLSQIHQLEVDVNRCRCEMVSIDSERQELRRELSDERRLREKAEDHIRLHEKIGDDLVPIRLRIGSQKPLNNMKLPQERGEAAAQEEDVPLGCGNCTTNTRCDCIEQAFEMSGIAQEAPLSNFKRPHSPASGVECKRQCPTSSTALKPEEEDSEIDFTEQFSMKRPPTLPSVTSNSLIATSAPDPCGFCQDGTACICAELAAEEKSSKSHVNTLAFRYPPKPLEPSANPSVNGPGSCQQCRSDPKSTLFCKSLAAFRKTSTDLPLPAESSEAASQSFSEQPISGATMPCAAAFTVLSDHRAYEQASEDPGAWMHKLTAIPGDVQRSPFEVEAASVMQTLRFMDRRFGRDV